MTLLFSFLFLLMVTGIFLPHLKVWEKFYLSFVNKDVYCIYKNIMDSPKSWQINESHNSCIEVKKQKAIIKYSQNKIHVSFYNNCYKLNSLEEQFLKHALHQNKNQFIRKDRK